jgi:hypothetical protein
MVHSFPRFEAEMPTSSDAAPAYHGYRVQALYTLWRILTARDKASLVFQPEGQEDLAVLDANARLQEVAQVKGRSHNLTLSSLSPHRDDSFFYRVAEHLRDAPNLSITIALFGAVGPELERVFQGDVKQRKETAKKLSGYNRISESDADQLLARIKLELVNEAAVTEQVHTVLAAALTGVDTHHAADLLTLWLYRCAEQKRKITYRDIIEKVNSVGKFLIERAASHLEWLTSIVPLEYGASDVNEKGVRDGLSTEFYHGIAARYEHILAGVDVRRPQKMAEIAAKFANSRVVFVHGPSGQGKTALALRYLHEYFPSVWRFRVRAVTSREQTLRIATALSGHADAFGVPLAVYLDVSHADDNGWPELVRQLSTHRGIQVLVTVRQEDWQRANIAGTEFEYDDVELALDRAEAKEIYQGLAIRRQPVGFVDFHDAWNRFGEAGPLLEFVYLVTQGESLRERLTQQVRRLEDEVRGGKRDRAELELLHLVQRGMNGAVVSGRAPCRCRST